MKTKFYYLLIAIIISATSLKAQSQYFVYSITGTAAVLKNNKPDYVIIFPWNLKEEIMTQLDYIKSWGGKFVIAIPEDDLIIVRLGHLKGVQTSSDPHSEDLYLYVEETYKMLESKK